MPDLRKTKYLVKFLLLCLTQLLQGVDRFPKPEFETDYVQPLTSVPTPGSLLLEYVDVLILFLALITGTILVIRKRSRNGMVLLSVFSILYFGFFKKGCVCSVGAVQNIVLTIAKPTYFLPLSAALFFLLPLIFALFFGRIFCGAVCPIGAVQDLVLVKSVKIPRWLNEILSLVPVILLSLAVLMAGTGAGFLICRLDPFIPIFRIGGGLEQVIFGISFLILSMVVGRPYCRFLCPYGVLLSWMSFFSRYHLKITPDDCTSCQLCEEACPYLAIAVPESMPSAETRQKIKHRFLVVAATLPLWLGGGAWLGQMYSEPLSYSHHTVALAGQISEEILNPALEPDLTSRTFNESGSSVEELLQNAALIQKRFRKMSIGLGMFLGLVFWWKSLALLGIRNLSGYEPVRSACFSCARCQPFCPQDPERRRQHFESGV